jgi:hypothetical protein
VFENSRVLAPIALLSLNVQDYWSARLKEFGCGLDEGRLCLVHEQEVQAKQSIFVGRLMR